MDAREVRNEELGHKRHPKERTFLPSLKTDELWLWKSCSTLVLLKMSQLHSFSVPLPPTILLHLGIIFSTPVTLFPAVPDLRCNALLPPHLLKHELSYWSSRPFQGLEVLEMTRTDFPMAAVWRSSDTFPTFIVCVWGLLDIKLTGNRSNRWNCEVRSD